MSAKKSAVPRKKACQSCSNAKVRCDLCKPICSRCQLRGLSCIYTPTSHGESGGSSNVVGATRPESSASMRSPRSDNLSMDQSTEISAVLSASLAADICTPSTGSVPTRSTLEGHIQSTPIPTPTSISEWRVSENVDLTSLVFDNIDLVCTVDDSRVRTRWMESLLPSPTQRPKAMPLHTVQFTSRILSTYPKMLLQENTMPPIIHKAQLAQNQISTPLANCIMLARMWESQVPGSEYMVRETVKKEMDRLFSEKDSCNQIDLLATLQAYLLYAIMAFFHPAYGSSFIDQSIMIKLQELTGDVTSTGLMCSAELRQSRPDWESWIIAATKRRTIFTTYLFDNIVGHFTGTPTFIGEELASLPVSANKALWTASTRQVWNKAYNLYLSQWSDIELYISELWPQPEEQKVYRQKRVDRWLAEVDEFGMMLFAVTSSTHGT